MENKSLKLRLINQDSDNYFFEIPSDLHIPDNAKYIIVSIHYGDNKEGSLENE
jgi:hypothetical protein